MVRYQDIIENESDRVHTNSVVSGGRAIFCGTFTWHRISEVSGYWGKSEKIHSCKSCGFHFKSDFYNPDKESDSESLR